MPFPSLTEGLRNQNVTADVPSAAFDTRNDISDDLKRATAGYSNALTNIRSAEVRAKDAADREQAALLARQAKVLGETAEEELALTVKLAESARDDFLLREKKEYLLQKPDEPLRATEHAINIVKASPRYQADTEAFEFWELSSETVFQEAITAARKEQHPVDEAAQALGFQRALNNDKMLTAEISLLPKHLYTVAAEGQMDYFAKTYGSKGSKPGNIFWEAHDELLELLILGGPSREWAEKMAKRFSNDTSLDERKAIIKKWTPFTVTSMDKLAAEEDLDAMELTLPQ